MDLHLKHLSFGGNGYFSAVYNALDFKALLERTLEREGLTQEIQEKLKELNRQTGENDNPVLLVGQI